MNDKAEDRLVAEQVALLYQQGLITFVGNSVSAIILVWLLWEEPAERQHLLVWFIGLLMVLSIRWGGLLRYRTDPRRMERGAFWGWAFTAGAAASGIVWGYLSWGFFQPNLFFLFPIALMMAGQTALSVPTVGVFLPAHMAFNLFSMTPFMLRNLLEEGRLFFGQGIAILIFMIVCLVFARRQQAMIREAIRLRLANLELLERAEEANTAKSRFLAAASHDLRQPLQAISLFTHVMAQDASTGREPDASLVGKLQSSCESLETLLDSLLDLSRAEAGALKPEICDVPLQPLFERLRHEFTDQAAAKGLQLRVVPTRHVVRSDPVLLERMLRNLVANALRYTEQGAVLVGCRRHGERLRIEVRDSGIGIPAELRSEIFREFYQLGNPERDRRKGLGLGLAIVNALAKQLGHEVDVHSTPGKGAVFTVTLIAGTDAPAIIAVGETLPDRLRCQLVVVIDDEPMIRDALSRLLASWGCEVAAGEDADEVLARLAGRIPAAILADRRLRGGRLGTHEITRLHLHCGKVPAILITGDTAPEAMHDIDFPVIRKPVQGFRLRAELDALLAPVRAA